MRRQVRPRRHLSSCLTHKSGEPPFPTQEEPSCSKENTPTDEEVGGRTALIATTAAAGPLPHRRASTGPGPGIAHPRAPPPWRPPAPPRSPSPWSSDSLLQLCEVGNRTRPHQYPFRNSSRPLPVCLHTRTFDTSPLRSGRNSISFGPSLRIGSTTITTQVINWSPTPTSPCLLHQYHHHQLKTVGSQPLKPASPH